MEVWYIPLSILPGIGLLIMSTTNLQSAMSSEINYLIQKDCGKYRMIVEMKIAQLDRLNKALVCLYAGAASVIIATICYGLIDFLSNQMTRFVEGILLFGALSVLVALTLLTIFSFKAVFIKRQTLTIGLKAGSV